jgi:MFS family permease
MPVLVVQILEASPIEVGLVSAAQFLPYALLGLIAGVFADRWRRKPVLVWASVGRAASLAAIPVLWMLGMLQIWLLIVLLLVFGSFSVFGFAATQSLLPRIVPRTRLVASNARIDQSDAAAQTLGPALGGGLTALLGAPIAIIVDAFSYVVDAVLIGLIRVDEPRTTNHDRSLAREVREGLRFTYRHHTLLPLALSTHLWFLANAAALTALSLLTLRSLAFPAPLFGLLLAVSGVCSLVGASMASNLGRRFGAGTAIVTTRGAYPIAWLLVALAPSTPFGVVLIFVGLAIYGLASGLENPNEMGYWQAATPDGLLGRVNATRRAANRTIGALGAVTGGAAVSLLGERTTLLGVVAVFVAAFAIAAFSPVRHARLEMDG